MFYALIPRERKTRYIAGLAVLVGYLLLLLSYRYPSYAFHGTPITTKPQNVPNPSVHHELPAIDVPVTHISETHTATAYNVPSTEATQSSPLDDVDWVLSSWMDYPNPLSFQGSPPLLDPANPKPLNVLLVNDHSGVENEIHAVFHEVLTPLGVTANITYLQAITEMFEFGITDEMARKFFFENRDYCNSSLYDVIVVGDVISFSRPFLQAACRTNIILYVTQRFDFGVWGNPEFQQLLTAASGWPNVRVMVNNLWEIEYARKYRNAPLHVFAYTPSTGILSPGALDIFRGVPHTDLTNIGMDEFTMGKRDNEEVLQRMCDHLSTTCPIVIPVYNGGPMGIADRLLVHIPYQVNTMSLFENLNHGVLYILPSARLYNLWVDLGIFVIDGRGEGGESWNEALTSFVDWWRDDLQPLFFYFEEVRDLAPGSAFHKKVLREAGAKRERVRKYMEHHRSRSLGAWRQALESFHRLSDSKPLRRLSGDPDSLPVAHLPPPVPDM